MAQPKIEKIAIIGATGHVGKHITEELLKTGGSTITALTRKDSKSVPPAGVKPVPVDYNDEQELTSALSGQQFLIITLPVIAPAELHDKIVKAAGAAGVKYIMPNAWTAVDIRNDAIMATQAGLLPHYCQSIRDAGSSWIMMICGAWYEWSLSLGEHAYGFDVPNRKVTLFDDGKVYVNTSTWAQCGRAIAALVGLPESGASPSFEDWKNEPLYISSFRVNQREMLDSFHRVLGTTEKDWEIKYESSEQRVKDGVASMQKGETIGFVKQIYSRLFFPSADGDFGARRSLANDKLDLPTEDLDTATKRVVDMLESGWKPFGP